MSISLQSVMMWIGAVFIGTGLGLLVAGRAGLGGVTLATGVLVLAGGLALHYVRAHPTRPGEPDQIERLGEDRRLELVRGTSMHLRDMRYRYSLRYDRSDRDPFTAEVNTVILGFVPVVILDNQTDRQGLGFVAFPYDGERWRGPGLPCSGDRGAALEHAARCVSPLDDGHE